MPSLAVGLGGTEPEEMGDGKGEAIGGEMEMTGDDNGIANGDSRGWGGAGDHGDPGGVARTSAGGEKGSRKGVRGGVGGSTYMYCGE